MKKISSEAKRTIAGISIIISSIIVLVSIALHLHIQNEIAISRDNKIIDRLTPIAESYGLKDVKIDIYNYNPNNEVYDVIVESSNFNSLSYEQMYALDLSMQVGKVYVYEYVSDGDTYMIYPDRKAIYKNDYQVHDDYFNSESYNKSFKRYENQTKPATTKKKSYSNSFTPYRSPSKDDDPYNAKDYSNEEDFYYDHYDDFFDYYDAENYYDEHNE